MRTIDPKKQSRIVTAAAELFAELPFEGLRMADVALRAKVAKGTLYLYFTNKEELFRAVIADTSGQALDQVHSAIQNLNGFEDKLQTLIRAAVKFTDKFPHYLETLHRLDAAPNRRADTDLQAKRERLFDMIDELLKNAHASKEITAPNSERSTLALLGMLHRVMHGTPRPWRNDLADWIVEQFLYGVRSPR